MNVEHVTLVLGFALGLCSALYMRLRAKRKYVPVIAANSPVGTDTLLGIVKGSARPQLCYRCRGQVHDFTQRVSGFYCVDCDKEMYGG